MNLDHYFSYYKGHYVGTSAGTAVSGIWISTCNFHFKAEPEQTLLSVIYHQDKVLEKISAWRW